MASHAHALNELDPHGGTPHVHHVTPGLTLKLILGLLLFFTLLTVGQAQAEKWIAFTFDVDLPNWLNVVIVMTIAAIKATLVLLYFMHLRHDNPINAIIFGFTILGVVIFMFFTFLDIGNRGYIDAVKGGPAIGGGSGNGVKVERPSPAYAGFTGSRQVYSDLPLFLGGVKVRLFEIEGEFLPKYHPALLDARAAELDSKPPTDAMLKLVADAKNRNVEMSLKEAARRIAFDDTLSKAREMAAPEVAEKFIHEFEHHIEHGQMPNAQVMKLLEQDLGPAAFARLKAIGEEHVAAREPHGLIGDDADSSANFSRARKGRSSGLFEAARVEPSAHGAAH